MTVGIFAILAVCTGLAIAIAPIGAVDRQAIDGAIEVIEREAERIEQRERLTATPNDLGISDRAAAELGGYECAMWADDDGQLVEPLSELGRGIYHVSRVARHVECEPGARWEVRG